MLKKLFVAAALIAVVSHANAGFVTGYIVGSSTSSKPASTGQSSELMSSDVGHDVISCMSAVYEEGNCYDRIQTYGVTPAAFAARGGYKIIHKKGIIIQNGKIFIIMEVSK